MNNKLVLCASIIALIASGAANADSRGKSHAKFNHDDTPVVECPVTHAQLKAAIINAVTPPKANGGLGFNMWASVVNAEGVVCAVAKSGSGLNSQWLGSRVISAQKAYTANAFSLTNGGLALSTANLYTAVQPGGSLFGLQHSNPVDTQWAYAGNAKKFGRADDPMTGRRIGGVNVFGGGLALYEKGTGKLLGAVGVSGDTSCADHNIAWRVRDELKLDNVVAGVGTPGDNIIYDETNGFHHAKCSDNVADDIAANQAVLLDAPLGGN